MSTPPGWLVAQMPERPGLVGSPADPAKTAEYEAKVASVLDRARKIEAGHGGRKQHLVPASYLNRWAEDGQVRVTETDSKRTYLGKPEKVGFETDFYRLEADGLDPDEVPPLAMEVFLSDVEGAAKLGIDELLETGIPGGNSGYLAWFIALQATRGRAFRNMLKAQVHQLTKIRYEDLDEAGVRELMDARRSQTGAPSVTDEDVAAGMDAVVKIGAGQLTLRPQDAALAAFAAEAAGQIVELLMTDRHWVVYDTPAVLMTCDEPVVTLGGPASPRQERAGFARAPVVLFPLAPTKLLVLLRGGLMPETRRELDHLETAEVNREMVAASTRWVFERPSRNSAARVRVPTPAPPVQVDKSDRKIKEGRVLYRSHQPTRWANAPHQPWPVARWWEAGAYW